MTFSLRSGYFCVLLLMVCLVGSSASAEWRTTPTGDVPSLSQGDLAGLAVLPQVVLDAPDRDKLLAEDALDAEAGFTKGRRVGLPRKIAVTPSTHGLWETLKSGDRLWRLKVGSRNARWLVLGFTTFRLPQDAALYVYGPGAGVAQGPIGYERVERHGQLWSTPIEGDIAIIELLWPGSLKDEQPNLHLGVLSHGYRQWGGIGKEPLPDPGADAGSCNIDINCPLGDNWQDVKHGGVMTLINGSRHCSGSLIAAAGGGDCRNYMLTANHCHSSATQAPSVSLMFNFERPGCETGVAPTDQVLGGGAVQRATWSSSDVTLLEMNDDPPASFLPYWNGWNRSPVAATETYGIHHPSNDEKKICYNQDPAIDGSNYGADHWRITEWEQGTTEGGSSGSPLFDQDQRIIGQLHGGQASCTNITWDEYGKLAVSWEGGGTPSTRLKDWLDPDGTGEEAVDGSYGPTCGAAAPNLTVSGTTLDDSAGNGDGIIDVDEKITLLIDLENRGTLDATSVSGSLSVLTPEVLLLDGGADWVDVPAGQIRTSNAPHFILQTTPAFVCGTTIELDLAVAAAERPTGWTRRIVLPTGTGSVIQAFADDVESGQGTWTVASLSGTGPWSLSADRAASPVTSWFVADPGAVTDQVLIMEALDPVDANMELTFQNRINSEGSWDGGVLEYAVAGGAWQDAGSLIVEGGYTSTLSSSSNPLSGREVWAGDNGGFETVRVDLATLDGQTVQFRWRFGSDSSVSDEGWYIDDIQVQRTEYSCQGLPLGEASEPGVGLPFTLAKDPGGYLLNWSAPAGGGVAEHYALYRTGLGGPVDPTCEADLGSGTSAVLADLTDGHGFLVVAVDAAGEGSYGRDSNGAGRAAATGSAVCP